MPKTSDIPFSKMRNISDKGVFVKHFTRMGNTEMKHYAHRDDYYMTVLLTDGSAAAEIDFGKMHLNAGEILIVSPWQVHRKPAEETWSADGWLLAFSPEFLSEQETRAIEEYSISPRPLKPDKATIDDIATLCSMLQRHINDKGISSALASAIKSLVLSAVSSHEKETSGRYMALSLRLRKLLDKHLAKEKSPAAYADMMNISEVYLNEAVKGATGLSAGAYIRSCAIIEAKRQLAYTSLSAKEIAYSLGYGDYAYFSKLFRKCAGLSPSAYRRNLK